MASRACSKATQGSVDHGGEPSPGADLPMPFYVPGPGYTRENSLCHCRDISKTQRQYVQVQDSILIPTAFTLSWQLTPRIDPRYGSQQTKCTPNGNSGSLACRGAAIGHPAIHTGRTCAAAWTSKALCRHHKFYETREHRQQTRRTRGKQRGLLPSPRVHGCQP